MKYYRIYSLRVSGETRHDLGAGFMDSKFVSEAKQNCRLPPGSNAVDLA